MVIDFQGSIDGTPFEGGAAADFPLVLGSKVLIDGFDAGLVGARAGEARTLDLQFPADYRNARPRRAEGAVRRDRQAGQRAGVAGAERRVRAHARCGRRPRSRPCAVKCAPTCSASSTSACAASCAIRCSRRCSTPTPSRCRRRSKSPRSAA
ncbi:MAG: FKBP-type peptidyl-prolyl cis-trans isomerase [Comamonadaceae bacterium]|nr:FKBP-type peptidyl-prolyl cis-trans isomerase [Comamonadaceae bacterium]